MPRKLRSNRACGRVYDWAAHAFSAGIKCRHYRVGYSTTEQVVRQISVPPNSAIGTGSLYDNIIPNT